MFLGQGLEFWLLAITVTLLIAMAKTAFGGIGAAIATPLLALVMPVGDAAALLLPLLIAGDISAVYYYRQRFSAKHLKITLPAAMVGIILGSIFFKSLIHRESLLKFSIGIIAIAFVMFQVLKPWLFAFLRKAPGPMAGIFWGAFSGFSSTLAHVGGPPFSIYLLPQALPKDIFSGTNAVFFLIVNSLKLIPYALLGLLTIGKLPIIALLLLLIPLGARLGRWVNTWLSPYYFNLIVYVLLFLTGLQLILGKSLVQLLKF
ncbi:MAG: sulfite exporter TauE/SafE family protein [Deinococcales bacterium]